MTERNQEHAQTRSIGVTRRAALRAGAATLGVAAVGTAVPGLAADGGAADPPRVEALFDEDWRFFRGDAAGAERIDFADGAWRKLDLPHDWRIEDLPGSTSDDGGATADPSLFAFTPAAPGKSAIPRAIGPFDADADTMLDADLKVPPVGSVKIPGGRGQAYTVAGVGWYRKRFRLQAGGAGQQVELRFDGVYQNADVWLNGVHLGFHPNGYLGFAYDLTPHLRAEGENVLAVRVDNRGKTSRWYSGSGIYRHTWLTITGPVRIPLWGVRVTTPVVDGGRAEVQAEVQVTGSGTAAVRLTVLDPRGKAIATQATPARPIAEGAPHSARLAVRDVALWAPETPHLYTLLAEVLVDGRVVDAVTARFGIRSIGFDGRGFLLNGKSVKINGANIHHDHGPLGAISLGRADARTVEILKAAGFNAIRTAHNPASPTLLDACDRLGMLVYTEFNDNWDKPKMADDYSRHFKDNWQRDLTSFIRRDRNHPSIVIWSIGNEIFEDPNGYGAKLAALARSLDPTRPVAQGGINVADKTTNPLGYSDVGDFHGTPPAEVRAANPNKAFLQSEDTSPYIYEDWKLAQDNPAYVGSWVWAGWDYMGESGGGATVIAPDLPQAFQAGIAAITGRVGYPWYVSGMGDIDLIGQRKPQNYWRAVVNGFSPLELMVERPVPAGMQQFNVMYCYYDELESWTWDVPAGQPMKVRVYAAGDSVTLLLNGKPVATKALAETDKRVATFTVPYAPGELVAVTSRGGRQIARKSLVTVGAPAALRLTSDVKALTTGRDDLAHVLVEVIDAQGGLVPDAVKKISFAIAGAGALAGVANGNPHNVDSFQRPRRWTWHGQALAVLRPARQTGSLTLMASTDGLRSARLMIPVVSAPHPADATRPT